MPVYKFITILVLLLFFSGHAGATVQDEIAEKNRRIEEIMKQIAEHQTQAESARAKAKPLESEIARLNAEIKQAQMEISVLNLSISKTTDEIGETEGDIGDTEKQMAKHMNALTQYLKLAYENDQRSLTEILLKNESLSDFFNELNNISATQDNLQLTIKSMKDLKSELETHQTQLEEQQTELEQARRLQEIEKRSIDSTKAVQAKLLKDTKGEESKYQELITKSQRDIEAIRAQISYLLQNGISAEEAVKYGQLAAIGAGIRPAFLLAELEQESALGSNVGKCYIVDSTSGKTRRVTGEIYAKGIHPTRDLALFLSITRELGKDPFQTPVSCGQGWGGAMGAAQFIPSTWMGYRETVSRITGRTPADPWNMEDAFVAAAAKLSKDGANSQTRAGEIAASKRYYCGSATSTKPGCINYANSVQRLAAEIAKNL